MVNSVLCNIFRNANSRRARKRWQRQQSHDAGGLRKPLHCNGQSVTNWRQRSFLHSVQFPPGLSYYQHLASCHQLTPNSE